MESEPIITRIADSTQQVQQQQCLRSESQTKNSKDKPSGEESTNEPNKTGNLPNGDECQKSQGWKRFSLKRQLSKVDLKIKNTFTPSLVSSQNGVLVCFTYRSLYHSRIFYIDTQKSVILSLLCFFYHWISSS